MSPEYTYFYYYSDAILTICLYFALMGLYAIVFEELKAGMRLRVFMMLLLIGTALFSLQRGTPVGIADADALCGGNLAEPLFRRADPDVCIVGRAIEAA